MDGGESALPAGTRGTGTPAPSAGGSGSVTSRRDRIMSLRGNRREFLKGAGVTGLGLLVADSAFAAESKSPNERVNFACIGVGGKGDSDTADADRLGNVVSICDV